MLGKIENRRVNGSTMKSECTPPETHFTSRFRCDFLRYLFRDAWNILDTATILCVTTAFVYRIIALRASQGMAAADAMTTEEQESRFKAQCFLAASAPLLFARLLSLSQIDDTLGPMTRVSCLLVEPVAPPDLPHSLVMLYIYER